MISLDYNLLFIQKPELLQRVFSPFARKKDGEKNISKKLYLTPVGQTAQLLRSSADVCFHLILKSQ